MSVEFDSEKQAQELMDFMDEEQSAGRWAKGGAGVAALCAGVYLVSEQAWFDEAVQTSVLTAGALGGITAVAAVWSRRQARREYEQNHP